MGWASGSQLATDIWILIRPKIKSERRKAVANDLIDIFEAHDCDTMNECEQLLRDAGKGRNDPEAG